MGTSGNSTFVKYILVCGLENSSGLEVDDTTSSSVINNRSHDGNPLQKTYRPRILRSYPDISSWSQFNPEAASRLILPQGLRFCTDKEISQGGPGIAPKCHSFVLTKEDGEKSYGLSIVFYEPVQDNNICNALHTLQKMYYNTEGSEGTREASTNRLTTSTIDSGVDMNRSVDASSLSSRNSGTIGIRRPRSARVSNERSRSLPRQHYTGQYRLSSSTLDLSSAYYDYQKDILYVTKSVAMVLSEPMVSTAENILLAIYKYINKSDFDIQVLEGLINNLLHDIPLPSPGRSVRFWCLGEAVSLSMPKVPQELPLFDYELLQFFAILGVENAIKLWVCLLLENQILVYSSDFDKLMLVCESMTALAYPFVWPHVYVPLLPPSLENFLDAPVPYVMGLLRRAHDVELYQRGGVCIVDIDNGELDLPEELPNFPCESELKDEIESVILKYGGREGASLLRDHAIEAREILESSISNQNLNMVTSFQSPRTHRSTSNTSTAASVMDNSDTMAQLNLMISKFESLSQQPNITQPPKASKNDNNKNRPSRDKLTLNNAIREVFVNRFAHLFLSYEHFVIMPQNASSVEKDSTGQNISTADVLNLTPQQQDTVANFDKISFLSDQVLSHLPFLTSFLETQMFTVFVDRTIEHLITAADNQHMIMNVFEAPFEIRLTTLKEAFGESLVRTPTYKACQSIEKTNEILENRLRKVELTITPQKVTDKQQNLNNTTSMQCIRNNSGRNRQKMDNSDLGPMTVSLSSSIETSSSPTTTAYKAGVFPLFDQETFTKTVKRGRNKSGSRHSATARFIKGERKSISIDPSSLISAPTQKLEPLLNPSPASIAETNWKFVNQLLLECKTKTKRILLEKLGQEVAVQWGHLSTTTGTSGGGSAEENMLVASVCDLIERVWSHGLRSRQRKSAFWHYLFKYGSANEHRLRFKGTLGTQAYCLPLLPEGRRPYILPDHSRPIQVVVDPAITDPGCPGGMSPPFDSEIMASMHNVSTIHEIKTEIGYARAWIRLALERKRLSHYLQILLGDETLLKTLYKRYAFLRCEDEREQSLFHLQTLNTVDFSCFTNAYSKSAMLYQILIFPSHKTAAGVTTTANVWLHVVGSHGDTSYLQVPRGVTHFSFWSKNIGIVTSLRLGHDNYGSSPNWLIDHIILRNEYTGQTFKFICGRWLGQNADDGSTERYMVGYPTLSSSSLEKELTSGNELSFSSEVPNQSSNSQDLIQLVQECSNNPPETTCPPMQLKSTGAREHHRDSAGTEAAEEDIRRTAEEVVQLQTMLGDAINRIVKFHHKSLSEKISYAHLMCGNYGLVHALLYIFSYGYKSARLFGKNLSVWDFFLKVTMDFNQSIHHLLASPSAAGISNTSAKNSPMNSPIHRRGQMFNTLESPRSARKFASAMSSGGLQSMLQDSPRKSTIASGATLSRANQFRRMYTRLITKIETTCHRLGKDDKFQLFICLSVHDRLLGRIVTDLTKAVAAQQLYEEHAFMRDPQLTNFLSHILEALEEISVPVDPALKETFEKHAF